MSNTVKLNNDHNQLIDNLCDDPRVAMDKNTINAALLEMGIAFVIAFRKGNHHDAIKACEKLCDEDKGVEYLSKKLLEWWESGAEN